MKQIDTAVRPLLSVRPMDRLGQMYSIMEGISIVVVVVCRCPIGQVESVGFARGGHDCLYVGMRGCMSGRCNGIAHPTRLSVYSSCGVPNPWDSHRRKSNLYTDMAFHGSPGSAF